MLKTVYHGQSYLEHNITAIYLATVHCFISVARLSHNGVAGDNVHRPGWSRWLLDALHRTNHNSADNNSHRIVPVWSGSGPVRYAVVDRYHVSTAHVVSNETCEAGYTRNQSKVSNKRSVLTKIED